MLVKTFNVTGKLVTTTKYNMESILVKVTESYCCKAVALLCFLEDNRLHAQVCKKSKLTEKITDMQYLNKPDMTI